MYGKKVANKNGGLKPLDAKKLARSRVRGAVKRGDIKRPEKCEICSKTGVKLCAHHYAGYDKAYHIQWLCSTCHADVDRHTKARGVKHARAKLTDVRVRKIREELSAGKSIVAVAATHGVSKKTIFNIKHDRIWRHVT